MLQLVSHGDWPLAMAESGYDLAATLQQRKAERILLLEFVEMAELLPDAWTDENMVLESGQSHNWACHPPVTDILLWLECFSRLRGNVMHKISEESPPRVLGLPGVNPQSCKKLRGHCMGCI